jgi:hypothetical protein
MWITKIRFFKWNCERPHTSCPTGQFTRPWQPYARSRRRAAAQAEVGGTLIAAEREYIYRLFREGKITDEARRRIERELEEASIACKNEGGVEPPL